MAKVDQMAQIPTGSNGRVDDGADQPGHHQAEVPQVMTLAEVCVRVLVLQRQGLRSQKAFISYF